MIHAFGFLAEGGKSANTVGVITAFGSERLLKRMVLKSVVSSIRQQGSDGSEYSRFDGDELEWNRLNDELSTVSLFDDGGTRICVIENADGFVKNNRESLEKLAEHPPTAGCLILQVDTWPSNTRLYKIVEKSGLNIDCNLPRKGRSKNPDEAALAQWICKWAKKDFNVNLKPAVARSLVEMTEGNMGWIEQELNKLVLFVEPNGEITQTLVNDIVGGWKMQTVWETIDAAADGDADQALLHLDRLLQTGEHPLALFGQISWSLKRYAHALDIIQRAEREGNPLRMEEALKQAGFRPWAGEIEKAQQRMKQLGRKRVSKLLSSLVEIDLSLKGTHSAEIRARLQLEKLFVQMSRQMATR